ncbi:MAG: hypothetical protein H0T43_07390 [Solirubrobacterales bacterium]|nr:hypothetical protein [Solirubrobacterales bacterium]
MTGIENAERLVLHAQPGASAYVLERDNEAVATLEDHRTHVEIDFPGGEAGWRVEPYGSGWRLAFTRRAGGEPVAWYEGRRIRSGGRLVVAPDREYAVRSARLKRLDWTVRDGRRLLLDARGATRDGALRSEIALQRGAPDEHVLGVALAAIALLGWVSATGMTGMLVDGDIPVP